MLGVCKDPKLAMEPVVVLTRLQLKQHDSHLIEGNDCLDLNAEGCKGKANYSHRNNPMLRKNTQSFFQLYNPSSPLVDLIRKRESAVSKMNENVIVVNSLENRSNILVTKGSKKAKNQGRSIKRSIKRSKSPERAHKCSQCQESFHTSTLLAVHKRIHDQENDDDTDIDVGVEEAGHVTDHLVSELGPSRDVLNPQSHNDDGKNARRALRTRPGTSTKSSGRTMKHASQKGPRLTQLSKCLECPATFSQDWYLQLHMVLLHFINKKSIHCPGCSVECGKEESLRQHIQTQHPEDLEFMNNEISSSLGLSVDSLTGEHLRSIRRKLHPVSFSDFVETRESIIRAISKSRENTKPVITYMPKFGDTVHSNSELPVCSAASTFVQQVQPVISVTSKLADQALSVISHSSKFAAPPPVIALVPTRISCDWRKASPSQKDLIIDLVEAELKYIVTERSRLGDHFSYSDIQRLSLEVCSSLRILKFFDGCPPKRWAQRVLAKVRQIPRPGRFRFVHNFNLSYVDAITELSAEGLTEMNIFYIFEARLWEVRNGKISLNPSLKTHQGAIIPDGSPENSMGALLSFNAEGSKFLQPSLIYQGQPVQTCNLHTLRTRNFNTVSRELVECDYFCRWLSQILNAIQMRPMLFLVEGDVTHLPYSLIQLARENNVHILFLPSKKRFVHSHRLIMESVLFPLVEAFDKEMKNCMTTQQSRDGISLNEFGKLFDEALMIALQKVQIRRAFVQAGFLPLPPSLQVLEDATQDYLRGIDIPSVGDQNTSISQSPIAGDPSIPSVAMSLALPLQSEFKEEPVKFQLEHVKQESTETDNISVEIKEEPIESLQNDFFNNDVVNAPQFETVKVQCEDESNLCPSCGEIMSSIQPLADHQCKENLSMEDDPLNPLAPYICGDCGCGFNEKHMLRNHICHFSENEEVFTCPVCDSQFFEETAILTHRCHTFSSLSDECDLFTCHQCGMSFALKDTLDFHLSMHEKSIPRYNQAALSNPSHGQATAHSPCQVLQKISSTSTQEHGSQQRLRSKKSSSNKRDPSPSGQIKKQARMDSPASYLSSRSLSPAYSDSSRTLTASPGTLSSSSDQIWQQGQDAEASVASARLSCPLGGGKESKSSQHSRQLPPPPLPEHDYLGQIHCRTTRKCIHKAGSIHVNSIPTVRTDTQNKKCTRLNFLSIATRNSGCSKVSTSKEPKSPLSRKQIKKVQRRQRRMIGAIQNQF